MRYLKSEKFSFQEEIANFNKLSACFFFDRKTAWELLIYLIKLQLVLHDAAQSNEYLKDDVKSVCAYVLRRPTFQWSGLDHWNVVSISHLPNFLELNL